MNVFDRVSGSAGEPAGDVSVDDGLDEAGDDNGRVATCGGYDVGGFSVARRLRAGMGMGRELLALGERRMVADVVVLRRASCCESMVGGRQGGLVMERVKERSRSWGS